MLKDKQLDLLIKLGSFNPKFIFIRNIFHGLSAVLILQVSALIANEHLNREGKQLLIYIVGIASYISLSEVNLLMLRLLGRVPRLRSSFIGQAAALVAVSSLVISLWVKLAEQLFTYNNILQLPFTQVLLLTGFLIILINLLMFIISNLTKAWIENRKEINELREAKLLSDYNLLKDRLNPHFLFNNLSVLKSLIHYSPADAEVFTQNFTNVYRYVLKSHDSKIVTLREELKFLESYAALHKERIGDGINVSFTINSDVFDKSVPPLALQLLVENAVKHNVANKANPLLIELYSDDNYVYVRNNLNKKETTYSTATGLKSLQMQYQLIADQEIIIDQTNSHYTVGLPLL